MTFSLRKEERQLLAEAESVFMLWCRSEAEFAGVLSPDFPKPKRPKGSPGNHLGNVWVRISAMKWLASTGEPAAKDGRFPAAVIEFAQDKSHLPKVGVDLIEAGIKLWRNVGFPATRPEDNAR